MYMAGEGGACIFFGIVEKLIIVEHERSLLYENDERRSTRNRKKIKENSNKYGLPVKKEKC